MNRQRLSLCCDKRDEYYEFGKQYFGPFLLSFTRWLNEQIKIQQIDKLFFFARDGYMMEKAFGVMSDNSVDEKYAYFSRKSIRQALLHTCKDYTESLEYISAEKSISFGALLEYYGFNEDERIMYSKRYSLDLKTDFDTVRLKTNSKLKNIFHDLRSEIYKRSCEQDALLFKYLKQIDIVGKVGIVDIGWKGSMQYYLETYLKLHDMDVCLVGFYVGILPKQKLSGHTFGFLYDEENQKLRKKVLCFAGGLERLFQSLEGSTYGYKEISGDVCPVLNTYEFSDDPEVKMYITQLQNGAMDYVKANKYTEGSDEALTKKILRLGIHPTLKEVSLFSPFYNTDGAKEYYISQKPIYKYGFNEFRHALSNSAWKTGFLKSVFKVPFPYFWIYNVLKK